MLPVPPPKAGPRLKWYHLVIAGVVGVFLLCSCAAVVAYRQFGRTSGDIAACDLAMNAAVPTDAADVRTFRTMAGDFRTAAGKADSADLRAAMLAAADAFEKSAAADDEVRRQRGNDTGSADASRADAQALREVGATYRNMQTLCEQAGWPG
ncbi:hypothetical protein [Dactylosporangium sp. NPDC049140]|uniref:hypothetical protein n=1 Tax=Dactylosporangium sp. NPDC049140 TaxID=3155647 RepID=UPI0033FEEAB5